jgi:hypothetical protein
MKVFRDITHDGIPPSENMSYIYLISLDKITIYINNTIRKKPVEKDHCVIFQKQ